jgi:glycosyltransferase involved in cell wall biosynthesis
MSANTDLSVVVPCFNEEEGLPEFHRRMAGACTAAGVATYEIIYINDGSNDSSLKIMRQLQEQDHCVRIIDLARNHGHQIALSAGLAHARGAYVLAIDADLQDPPELLAAMMQKIEEGADVVYAQRKIRKGESRFKLYTAAAFYRLLGRVGGSQIPVDTGDFRLMKRNVVDVLVNMPEAHRFIRGLVAWIGFTQVPVIYERDARFAGRTKYPFLKMLAFSLDAMTAFATGPLRIMFLAAILAMGLAVLMLGWTFYAFFFQRVSPGWSSVMTVLLFFASVQLFALAVIGEYVGRIFVESKRRPLYVIRAMYPPDADVGSVEGKS